MTLLNLLANVCLVPALAAPVAETRFEKDKIPTAKGDLQITFIGHGTLMFEFGGLVIHVDPVSRYADYAKLPKADVILVTHEHGDHLDKKVIDMISTKETILLLTEACAKQD